MIMKIIGTVVNNEMNLVGLLVNAKPEELGYKGGKEYIMAPCELNEVKKWIKDGKIEEYKVNKDGIIDAVGYNSKKLSTLPMYDTNGNSVDKRIEMQTVIEDEGYLVGGTILFLNSGLKKNLKLKDLQYIYNYCESTNFILKNRDGNYYITGKSGKKKEEIPVISVKNKATGKINMDLENYALTLRVKEKNNKICIYPYYELKLALPYLQTKKDAENLKKFLKVHPEIILMNDDKGLECFFTDWGVDYSDIDMNLFNSDAFFTKENKYSFHFEEFYYAEDRRLFLSVFIYGVKMNTLEKTIENMLKFVSDIFFSNRGYIVNFKVDGFPEIAYRRDESIVDKEKELKICEFLNKRIRNHYFVDINAEIFIGELKKSKIISMRFDDDFGNFKSDDEIVVKKTANGEYYYEILKLK